MDSDASSGEAGEAFSFGLGTPTGASIGKKTRAVRRGSKRMREETEADEIQVRDPVVFNSAGRISNAELLRAVVEEFNKAQAGLNAKYNVAIQEMQDTHVQQVEETSQVLARNYQEASRKAFEGHKKEIEKISKKHQEETEKINKKHQEETEKNIKKHQEEAEKNSKKHQEEIKKITENHQNEHQNVSKQVQELRKQLEDSRIHEMGDAMRRVEEQLTQLSIAGSASPATTASSPAATQPRQTWSQVASQKGPSIQHSARTELLSDSEASHNAQPLANEGKTMEIDISRARGDKDDLNMVKAKWIKALQENPSTEDVGVEFLREIYTNKVELCLATVEQAQRARDNPRWIEKAMPGARIRGETWFPIKVDGISKNVVLDPSRGPKNLKPEVVTNFATDNSKDNIDCTAMKAVWISRPSDKVNGSMIVWLKKREAAAYLLKKMTVIFGPTAGFAAPYQPKENNDPCFNCNTYGHYQFKCKKPAKCGHCSGNHQSRECMDKNNLKCPACNGPHSIMDRRVKYQEEDTGSPDIAAATIQMEGAQLLRISVYVPYKRPQEVTDLQQRIATIQETIQKTRRKTEEALHVYVGGDFNRHSNVWGGREVAYDRRGDDWPILQFMVEEELDSMLPRGTITYSHNNGSHQTTIDLVLVSPGLQAAKILCRTSSTDHGGDHKVIETRFQMPWEARATRKLRRMYDKADWVDICKAVGLLPQPQPISTKQQLNREAEEFVKGIQAVRKDYLSQIANQKAAHWREFVDSPENVWKANKYTHMDPGSRGVPTLQGPRGLVDQDEEKAAVLLQAFFPPQPEPEDRSLDSEEINLRAQPYKRITEAEVRTAIFRSSPRKAPGPDDIPFLVWQKVWEEAKGSILALYRASLRLSHLPSSWRTARIVPLRKPGKPDYTIPKAFRPISLLATISKGLEAVVANRLSFMAEKHNLLPSNHFGARKKRSCEQAINVLVERIYEAWRNGKVVSLVTFDVQGAFNGVNTTVLQERLEQRGIPGTLSEWVGDFCRERMATVTLDTFESDRQPIAQAGIPQGSPLSPILYIFYNANLVERPIDKTQGALGFVDDYSPWVVGDDVDQNIKALQTTIIPKAERWARESGATFEPSKTGLIHFTRRSEEGKQTGPDLQFQGQDITPSEHLKLLGVTLDSKMKFHQHVARMTAKATRQCLAIRRLRGVRPKQVRQLYNATVTPIMDYCASAWATALIVAQAEAGIESTASRLQRKLNLFSRSHGQRASKGA
ncbi:hypothetical protein E4T50_17119 [Aureobasidium sp. EXF-12298]|nr:hypothetical protein E4T50_17119 [Aureobasidium sp. EXF-12298]